MAYLTEMFGLAEARIFSCTDVSFQADLLTATNGKGVDIVLDSLSGELLHAAWQCVAEGGVMLEVSKHDLVRRGKRALALFGGNRGFFGVDIARLCASRPLEATRLLQTIVAKYGTGEIKPLQPIQTFEATNISEAFRSMQQGKHIGTVAIRMPEDPESLPAVPSAGRNVFKPDVSYLLVGCLGHLGQAVATWMVERGARSLIFFSGSAANKESHGEFFDELEASGCSTQAFSGDVGRLDDVKLVGSGANKRIAGILQMPPVLSVRSYPLIYKYPWTTS